MRWRGSAWGHAQADSGRPESFELHLQRVCAGRHTLEDERAAGIRRGGLGNRTSFVGQFDDRALEDRAGLVAHDPSQRLKIGRAALKRPGKHEQYENLGHSSSYADASRMNSRMNGPPKSAAR